MNITIIGGGMGPAEMLTVEAREALARADAIIGGERLLAGLPESFRAEKVFQVLPEKIADVLAGYSEWRNVCVIQSGDTGFYSGARRLLELLKQHTLRLVPGISSPQYMAARLRRPWQDFHLVSAHGVRCDVLAEVLNHPAVFFLTDNSTTPAVIIGTLCEAGLGGARITVGENLSAPDERIVTGSAGELADGKTFSPLSVVLVENDKTFMRGTRSAGIPDGEFIRGDVPMTKREVRTMAISLLALSLDDVVYDVGAGTGSVAVEAALVARRGRVYAIENNANALKLLGANREQFGVYNMVPVSGTAPEALETLPPPQAVFIGGSKGRMRDVIRMVLGKNPDARLVASAVTLETLASAMDAMRELEVRNVEAVQIAASRAVPRGGYHMLSAQNPVFLISGGGD